MSRPNVNLPGVSLTFPELHKPLITRDAILDLIDSYHATTPYIFVKGTEGIGKTTLLAQFALRHSARVVSLFLRPFSRSDYSPDSVRLELIRQVQMLVDGVIVEVEGDLEGAARQAMHKVRTAAIRQGSEPIFFVVDGLEDIPTVDADARSYVLDLLPLTGRNIRFLFSGSPSKIGLSSLTPVETLLLAGFSDNEVSAFFAEQSLLDRDAIEIGKSCQRIPGRLAVVRRLLVRGTSIDSLLKTMPEEYEALVALEWSQVSNLDNIQKEILALIAFDPRRLSIAELSRIFSADPDGLTQFLGGLSFIEIDPTTSEVGYASGPHRLYAQRQLASLREQATNRVLDLLWEEQESEAALAHLPDALFRAGETDRLLDYLSPHHFERMIDRSRSFTPVREKASLGFRAALREERDPELLRFALQRSVMMNIASAAVWRSEISARMALDDSEAAQALANRSHLVEDRLHLLAVIAGHQAQSGQQVTSAVIDEIEQLAREIQHPLDPEYAIDIATDLIHTAPQVAAQLVEQSQTKDQLSRDLALTQLSIATMTPGTDTGRAAQQTGDIRSRIRDPFLRQLANSVVKLSHDSSAPEFIEEVRCFDSVDEQVSFLRVWATKNAKRSDALDLVEYALDLIIRSTEFPPTADALRELAAPLRHSTDGARLALTVRKLDAQLKLLVDRTSTDDFIALQVLLAEAEARYDFAAAKSRLEDAALYISEVPDIGARAAGLAYLLTSLDRLDPHRTLEIRDQLHSMVQAEFSGSVDQLLEATAEHFINTRAILRSLAEKSASEAFNLAKRLNTETRRDLAYLEIADAAMSQSDESVRPDVALQAIELIADRNVRDEAIINSLESLAGLRSADPETIRRALPLLTAAETVYRNSLRCLACCSAVQFLGLDASNSYTGLRDKIYGSLREAWEGIDVGWRKVDVGFRIAEALTKVDRARAQSQLDATEQFRRSIALSAGSVAGSYKQTVELAIRALGGLIFSRNEVPDDIDRIGRLIAFLPSQGERAMLWGRVAELYALADRRDECRAIVGTYVRPELEAIPEADSFFRERAVSVVAPCLYVAHAQSGLDRLVRLNQPWRDQGLFSICMFLLQKAPSTDPFSDSQRPEYNTRYEDLRDVCSIVSHIDNDVAIFTVVKTAVDAVESRRTRLSRQQQTEIIQILEQVITKKLPSKRYIAHDGYRIVALAEVARLRQDTVTRLNALAIEAEGISNLADKVLVLGQISRLFPARHRDRQVQIFSAAVQLAKELPTLYDRIERLETLADLATSFDRQLALSCLRTAYTEGQSSDDADIRGLQRRLIDLAHSINPDFASQVAAAADNDPARMQSSHVIRERLRQQELRKMLVNGALGPDATQPAQVRNISDAAWMALGDLHAGRTTPLRIREHRPVVEVAADMPLDASYPIQAWVIESTTRKYRATAQAGTILRPVFNNVVLGAELARRLIERAAGREEAFRSSIDGGAPADLCMVDAGEREKGIAFIRQWMQSHLGGYLKVCDPYLGPPEVAEILQLVREVQPDCHVQLLTAAKHQKDTIGAESLWTEAYTREWRSRFTQDPPFADVTIVGTEAGGASPIHDRWMVSNGTGLRMGTSLNSLGEGKTSELSIVSASVAAVEEEKIDAYLLRRIRQLHGNRLSYVTISVD